MLTLLITIDRFDHIHKPLKLERSLDSLRAKQLVAMALLALSLVIALPHGFLMVYDQSERDCDARAFFRRKLMRTNVTYYQLYFTFTEPVLIWFVPGILITCMNVYVVVRIVKTNSKRFTVTYRRTLKLFKRGQSRRESMLETDKVSKRSLDYSDGECEQMHANYDADLAETAMTRQNNAGRRLLSMKS